LVATVEKRLTRLEQSFGDGDECPRCRNTTIVIGVSGNVSVNKNGTCLTAEASRRFYDEERPDDRCPQCERQRHRVRITWGPGR
jgi:hypothetical protein